MYIEVVEETLIRNPALDDEMIWVSRPTLLRVEAIEAVTEVPEPYGKGPSPVFMRIIVMTSGRTIYSRLSLETLRAILRSERAERLY